MKRKIDFDVKYRPQIESGEYKVETKQGKAARIVCWDVKSNDEWKLCVLVLEGNGCERMASYNNKGNFVLPRERNHEDLVLVKEEPLTKFEVALEYFYNSHYNVCTYDNQGTVEDSLRRGAEKLLEIAKKELQPYIEEQVVKAYENADKVQYERGFEVGKSEIGKLKWYRDFVDTCDYNKIRIYNERTLAWRGWKIDLIDLFCILPKEE